VAIGDCGDIHCEELEDPATAMACLQENCVAELAACNATVTDDYDALDECISDNCPTIGGNLPSQQCLVEQVDILGNCTSAAEACVPDAGGGICSTAAACMSSCGYMDQVCFEACLTDINLVGQVFAIQYHACVQENCDAPYTEECLEQAKLVSCQTGWAVCESDQ